MLRSRFRELVAAKARQEKRDISGKEIAEITGMQESTISRWMSIRPFTRLEYPPVKKLADYLGVPWYEVVYEDVIAAGEEIESGNN